MADSNETVSSLQENDWEILLERIKYKRCTPILGPGMRPEGLALRTTIAQRWARQYDYPLEDSGDLARVSRFLSVKYDPAWPKELLIEQLKQVAPPDFDNTNEPYYVLAKLGLPVYITTNYDDNMERALASKDFSREPKKELFRWKKTLSKRRSYLINDGFEPTTANPLVYHLYGYPEEFDNYSVSLESLVLTEDDYLEFLINASQEQESLPPRIERAITGSSLLLLGYRLDDWDFRALFHLLFAKYLERNTSQTHVAVQISPVGEEAAADLKKKVQDYLDRYMEKKTTSIKLFWGTTQAFIKELKGRGGF